MHGLMARPDALANSISSWGSLGSAIVCIWEGLGWRTGGKGERGVYIMQREGKGHGWR